MEHGWTDPEIILLIVLAAFIAYSLLTRAIARTIVTLPMVFAAIGFTMSGPITATIPDELLDDGVRFVAEITLVLVLFSDASHVRLEHLRKDYKLPLRMLVLGMPMSVALGTAVVFALNPGAGIAMALLTAAVLTPTDAALGQQVVASPEVPQHLSETINVESGLNDGLALPFVLFGAITASMGAASGATDGLVATAVLQVVLGPVAGAAVGWATAKLMDAAQDRNLMAESAGGVVFLSTAFVAYFGSELIGGNGFIAAFVAGMVFGNSYRHDIRFIGEFMEGAGQLLTMSAFLIFGAILMPRGLAHASIPTVLIAVLFLSVVRMLPIFLSLAGTGLPVREKLFLGWFGPRGLASILFTLIMIDVYDIPYQEEFLACVSMTVCLSILAHGVTATPLARRIGKREKAA